MHLIEILRGPWPWYVGGVLVALMVPVLLIFGNKQFGISSSLRHFCAACIPTKAEYFNYNWKDHLWNIQLVAGIAIGGFIARHWLDNPADIALSEKTKGELGGLGITDFSGYFPKEVFSWEHLTSLNGILVMVVGGFLVGFGTRYSNGCTSGHSIMGLSLLSLSGLVATIGFFVGGLVMTHFLFPFIF
jgi:uncharacterized membrane protein YedE/YeeE